jgi:four helix bundle protein
MVRAADSIPANIAEGYGRYFYKESKQFYFYSRGQFRKRKPGCQNVKEEQ